MRLRVTWTEQQLITYSLCVYGRSTLQCPVLDPAEHLLVDRSTFVAVCVIMQLPVALIGLCVGAT